LEEIDHLHGVRKVAVEDERGEQGEGGKENGDSASLPSEDYGNRPQDLDDDDQGQDRLRQATGGHVGDGLVVRADLADPGDKKERRQQDPASDFGKRRERSMLLARGSPCSNARVNGPYGLVHGEPCVPARGAVRPSPMESLE